MGVGLVDCLGVGWGGGGAGALVWEGRPNINVVLRIVAKKIAVSFRKFNQKMYQMIAHYTGI